MHADAEAKLDVALSLHARGVLGEHTLHAERGPERALGIVLMRERCAEDDEDRVADELLDGAVLPHGLLRQVLEDAGHEHLQLLGIHLIGELREAREVREEDGDEAPFLSLLLQPLNDRRRPVSGALYPLSRAEAQALRPCVKILDVHRSSAAPASVPRSRGRG